MSRYLIDTDALIDYSKGREPATSRIQQFITQDDELGVCAINVAEFFAGIAPPDRAYWQQVFSTLAYWDVSPQAAMQAGEMRYDFAQQGQTLSTTDTLIAAVAMEHGATIITSNVKDYPMPGVQLLSLRR
ncbi:MAG: type II toxin-antitoxin system VapC family toxin [Chloroflexi bacterium]|nr:type II toxin-antitoxin system VapC family toxin [Chloroflexota bacterium]